MSESVTTPPTKRSLIPLRHLKWVSVAVGALYALSSLLMDPAPWGPQKVGKLVAAVLDSLVRSLGLLVALAVLSAGCSTTLVRQPSPAASAFDFSPPPPVAMCHALDGQQRDYGTGALFAGGVGVASGVGGPLNEHFKGNKTVTDILVTAAVTAAIATPVLVFRREDVIRQFVSAGCGEAPVPLPHL